MKKLSEIQVGKFDWRTMLSTNDTTPPDVITALDEYFAVFAEIPMTECKDGTPALSNPKCLRCDRDQEGMLGHFAWGIASGEGGCSCGYPARAHHRIKNAAGEVVLSFTKVIQYHPSVLSEGA